MITQAEIEQVVSRAVRGDRAAIGKLYETYVETIYRYVSYRVSASADVEDLTAEIFVKMLEGLPKYRPSGAPFEAWLYRIAFARVVDFRRRQRVQTEVTETLHDDALTPEENLQEQQELAALRRALSSLPNEQQHVLVLRFIEQKSHQEVADIIGKSVSAVKSIQHRALLDLTIQLGSEEKVRHYLRGGSHE